MMERYTTGDILIRKAHRGKLQEVVYLVQDIAVDVNYRNMNGCTPLHAAAASGQLEVVQWLLHAPQIDPSVVDDGDQTALHYAAFYGHLEVVQILVEHGVQLDAKDKFGRLPHIAAALNGHLDVIRYIVEDCDDHIDINAIDEYGGTCLHWAASKGRKEVVQYLCMAGIDIHVTSYDNRTAYQLAKDKYKTKCMQFLKLLIHAAEEGDDDTIKRVINDVNGAYPLRHLRDKNGKNAMHWAASTGHLSSLRLVAESFDEWTEVDKFGRNALHWAALKGHKDCAFWLIKNFRDSTQWKTLTLTDKTPSRCAFEGGHSALAAQLQAWEKGNAEYLAPEKPKTPVQQNRDIGSVRNWLQQLELGEYTDSFESDGFDTLRGVATMDEDDLIEMNVKKGHRRGILQHIQELKNQLAAYDEQAAANGFEPEALPTLSMLPQLLKTPSVTQLSALPPAVSSSDDA
ncbi:hypothetical protein SPRG_06785 [Saprolegnia parasitica CBS 223.65]|uniref:SAM domain-containing protein n=1 Tax=Saprolegnia parasitica (strain CBS 223.65) TaxID=695850 RepID=A0A067CAI4_SAPPC|nr:hypothetical protein SPRG_06785 [Saprolegnia parasitica CBS 223.65]KDO27518.1 hypothetical protein SPRG_06785 [Saprolegnia parasitica CBS 223.65]|eukprot:XP_012201645.1 hypothetical protein SPRG_06785 [Saprolegnia parasitica CBS 223.65]